MHYSQTFTAPEVKLPQWKPNKQTSYMNKLNNFVAEHACSNEFNPQMNMNVQQSWSPNMFQQQTHLAHQEMNTWSDKKTSLRSLQNYLQPESQFMSESHENRVSSKKLRNLSNTDNKMQRFASDHFAMSQHYGQQPYQKHFGQNQISVHSQSNALFKHQHQANDSHKLADWQQASTLSSHASTNDNSNSDVEIIEDDYAKALYPVPALLQQSKSSYQTTSDAVANRKLVQRQPFQLTKVYSTMNNTHHNYNHHHHNHHNCNHHHQHNCSSDMADDLSSFAGEATRSSQKKKFVNKEERFEFNQKIEKMKKTEMCRNILMYHHCKYGDACSYAHSMDELVPKQHLPSNYKTKMCTQYQEQGYCQYGQRCQFLHSIYDLSDKKNLSYKRGLAEEARLTWQRIQQGSDCIMVNILKGKGCVAPEERLPIFEQIYNKADYQAELLKKEQEKQFKGFSNSSVPFDSRQVQYSNNKPGFQTNKQLFYRQYKY